MPFSQIVESAVIVVCSLKEPLQRFLVLVGIADEAVMGSAALLHGELYDAKSIATDVFSKEETAYLSRAGGF